MPTISAKTEPIEDPSSSIIGRAPKGAYPGLDIEIDVMDDTLGIEFQDLAESLVGSVLKVEGVASNIAGELYIRIVSNDEMRSLNRDHRNKDKPTNVLSFQTIEGDDLAVALENAATSGPPLVLGDIIIAAPVVIEEARRQNKPPMHHFAHLLVHGLLHLLNYDHMEDEEAEEMEARERAILKAFSISDPYAAEQEDG